MPFTQVDENTVKDEEGHTYFAPFLNYNPGAAQAPQMSEDADATPKPDVEAPSNFPTFDSLPSTRPDGAGTGTELAQGAVGGTPSPASLRSAKAGPEAAKQALEGSDVTAFSQGGGTASSDADLARIIGGHAGHEAETANKLSEAAHIKAVGETEKLATQGQMMLDTATEYEAHTTKIMKESEDRFKDWKKRNDEVSSRLVDPRHAFTSMSALSKAGWMLQFLGAGLQGGSNVSNVHAALNKLVDQDIAAQRFNIENRKEGLNAEKGMMIEQDRMNKDSVATWYAARQLRFTAIGKMLDAKIAEMGRPAAEAANLLMARDAIEKEVIKGQQHIADHFFEDGQLKSKQAHDIYLERLKSKLKMAEDAYKESLKRGTEKNDTLPTNTQLGLQMVDKGTGTAVEGGKIPLKVKGEKAVEAGQILSTANEEASQLRDVQEHLKKMSSADLARGGTPEFKSMVKDLIQTRAVRDNGHRLSDDDVVRAAQEEFGVSMKDSLAANSAESMRLVGPYKDGVVKAIDSQLRNLSTRTTNKLHPYIDSDTAEKYDIQYNVQGTHAKEVSDVPDDLNTAITKAAGGADVSDVLVPGPRKPAVPGAPITKEETVNQYQSEKAAGRGVEGGLPILPQPEEDKVNQAAAAFNKATGEEILRLASAYLRDPKLSEEAKHEIRLEADVAQASAKEKEAAVIEEAIERYKHDTEVQVGPAMNDLPIDEKLHQPAIKDGKMTDEFKAYLNKDGLLDELRKRAGLEPRRH